MQRNAAVQNGHIEQYEDLMYIIMLSRNDDDAAAVAVAAVIGEGTNTCNA